MVPTGLSSAQMHVVVPRTERIMFEGSTLLLTRHVVAPRTDRIMFEGATLLLRLTHFIDRCEVQEHSLLVPNTIFCGPV